MNAEFRQHKQAIRSFMQAHYTDERLAQLLAHAQSGRLQYESCCCFIGVATADHSLQESMFGNDSSPAHYLAALQLSEGHIADFAYAQLSRRDSDGTRRRILIPMIRAEIRRRDRAKLHTCKHCGEEINQIADPWGYTGHLGREYGWHHVKATDNSDGKYITACQCKCADCYQPLGTGPCVDGEEAEPILTDREYCAGMKEEVCRD